MTTLSLSRRLATSAVIVVAAIAGAAIATLLFSPRDWGFTAMLVGAIGVVRVATDLVAWNRERDNADL